MEQIVWLIMLILFVVIEVATMGLTTIWFAAGALVALISSLLGAPVMVQGLLFVIISLVLLFFTRPIAVKYFNKGRAKTNVESVVGQKAIVTTEINNLLGTGNASLSGQEWTARSVIADQVIPEGTIVTVEQVDGVKLMVHM